MVLGPAVTRFEENMAQYCRCRHAIGVSSGTDALLCCLMALGIGNGDEVIVPTYTFFASAGAVARVGAKPVFVDIDAKTFNMDVEKTASAITKRTKAIMPVDLYGQSAPIKEIAALAHKHDLAVIEDACQSLGAAQEGKTPGQVSTCACLSFYPTKNLGGFGDGGMILCQDEDLAAKCKHLRLHGQDKGYYHSMVGANFRLDALQAVVLDEKLKYLDGWTAKRRRFAEIYNDLLSLPVQIPTIAPGNDSVYNLYVIRTPKRDELQKFLSTRQIGSGVYYPLPLHLQECFAYMHGKEGDCPVAEQACKDVLALPVYPELSEEQIIYVAKCINEFYER
jgi:dTDP-4-amino-4,6-dideoxygalactose transaminase